jgi:hypothetical protein
MFKKKKKEIATNIYGDINLLNSNEDEKNETEPNIEKIENKNTTSNELKFLEEYSFKKYDLKPL